MLSLRSFHLFLVMVSIVLTGGVGTWSVMHHHAWLGVLFLAVGVLLIVYLGYFATKTERT